MKEVLTKNGLVEYYPEIPMIKRYNEKETENIKGKIDFSKLDDHCEIAHIELTSECNRKCNYCYNPRNAIDASTEDFKTIIKKLYEYGIFQITFGGGEPFIKHEKLTELIMFAKELGITSCITTNGDFLANCDIQDVKCILENIGQINVSVHDFSNFNINLLKILLKKKRINFIIGINMFASLGMVFEDYIRKYILDVACENDIPINIISMKTKNLCTKSNLLSFNYAYKLFVRHKGRLNISVDSSCALECMASRRFVSIYSDGTVGVCSFVRDSIGNIIKEKFNEIWDNRPTLVSCPFFEGLDNSMET